METLNTDKPPELVSNIEVMEFLKDKIAARKKAREAAKGGHGGGTILRQREWIEESVLDYVMSTPCTQADPNRMPQLVSRLRGRSKEGFSLTDAETLQVLNFMPQEAVEIHLMVEELQTRISEERQGDLLSLVASCLKHSDNHADDSHGNGGDGIKLENVEDYVEDLQQFEDALVVEISNGKHKVKAKNLPTG